MRIKLFDLLKLYRKSRNKSALTVKPKDYFNFSLAIEKLFWQNNRQKYAFIHSI